MKFTMKKVLMILFALFCLTFSLYLFFGYKSKFYGLEVSRSIQNIALLDHEGNIFTEAKLKNKNSLLFFGYTKCYTVCPVSMKKLDKISKKIKSSNLQIIYITIDPNRDDIESLKIYLERFDHRFIGLRGTSEEIQQISKQFNVQISNVFFGDKSNPQFEHSGNIYFVDSNAKIKTIYPLGMQDIDKMVKEIQGLIKES
jgi:protein SCO1